MKTRISKDGMSQAGCERAMDNIVHKSLNLDERFIGDRIIRTTKLAEYPNYSILSPTTEASCLFFRLILPRLALRLFRLKRNLRLATISHDLNNPTNLFIMHMLQGSRLQAKPCYSPGELMYHNSVTRSRRVALLHLSVFVPASASTICCQWFQRHF